MQGPIKALDLQVKCIGVFSDSQVVIQHVINSIHCASNHLNNYQREVSNLMYKFESFNIRSILHLVKYEAYMMANVASNRFPSNNFSHDKFSVKLIYRSLILDNITNYRIIKDD